MRWSISSGAGRRRPRSASADSIAWLGVTASKFYNWRERYGGPKRRQIAMVPYEEARPIIRGIGKYTKSEEESKTLSGRQDTARQYIPRKPVTVGWEPDLPAIRRGVVLDPCTGTGTTGEVALKLGRHFVGIELYENYAEIAEERCCKAHILRSKYEEENPMTTPSMAAFGEPLDDFPRDEGS